MDELAASRRRGEGPRAGRGERRRRDGIGSGQSVDARGFRLLRLGQRSGGGGGRRRWRQDAQRRWHGERGGRHGGPSAEETRRQLRRPLLLLPEPPPRGDSGGAGRCRHHPYWRPIHPCWRRSAAADEGLAGLAGQQPSLPHSLLEVVLRRQRHACCALPRHTRAISAPLPPAGMLRRLSPPLRKWTDSDN